MVVTGLRLRDFRTYARAEVALGPGLTVVHGPNGAGKTNLLEALYFGCTGRSCRTPNEREVVRFEPAGGVVRWRSRARPRRRARAERRLPARRAQAHQVDGAPVERLVDAPPARS